jgi:ribosomal-protein-alanine N-acetyltransferase
LKTQRLRIEALAPEHAQAFLAFFDRNRAHLEPWEPKRSETFYTLEFMQADIAKSVYAAQRGLEARFVAFDDESEDIAVSINVRNIRRGVIQAANIGYAVAADRQGRGYATEAVAAVIRYAFDSLNLHRLETSYQPANERSGRVLRKLGFTIEGFARDYLRIAGRWRDGVLVSLINDSWVSEGASGSPNGPGLNN